MSADLSLEVRVAHLLVAMTDGHTVDLLRREPDGTVTECGLGVAVGRRAGCSVRVRELIATIVADARLAVPDLLGPRDEIRAWVGGVVGVVEASSEEYHQLWEHHASDSPASSRSVPLTWVSEASGHGVTVGELAGRPVHLSLRAATVAGRRLLFWDATSTVVDHDLIRLWLDDVLPGVPRTDAANFHCVLR